MTRKKEDLLKRPVQYDPKIAQKVCELIATHPEGLKKICKMNPDIPSDAVIYKWRLEHKDFESQFARAKRIQAELLAESLDDLLDEVEYFVDEKGIKKMDYGSFQIAREKAYNRRWLASKLAPKIYGERITIDSTEEKEKHKKEIEIIRKKLDEKNKKEF